MFNITVKSGAHPTFKSRSMLSSVVDAEEDDGKEDERSEEKHPYEHDESAYQVLMEILFAGILSII